MRSLDLARIAPGVAAIGRPGRGSLSGAALRRLVLTFFAIVLLGGCTGLPPRSKVAQQAALAPATAGNVQRSVAPLVRAHPKESGFIVLESGVEAFAARAWAVENATRSLDIQCYIWRADRTGKWMLERIEAAAARGVRVRLLLDDNNTMGLDALLARLDGLQGVEVRLFNPYRHRGLARFWDLLNNFERLNRRMHIKTFIADGHAAIFGGRNVGDEYFDATNDVAFADLDVLAVGPVVGEVVTAFDEHWNHAGAYPLGDIVGDVKPAAPEEAAPDAAGQAHVQALRQRKEIGRWRQGLPAGELVWGPAVLTVDPPGKIFENAPHDELMMPRLLRVIGDVRTSLDMVSPYFVPVDGGVDMFRDLQRRGVRTRVLTNSLAATDVAAVHSGYANWRPDLLRAGVELYEVRQASEPRPSNAPWRSIDWSRASLHAKTFAVDGERVYIGSSNFDPRSAWLNTEIGVLINHRDLARRINRAFDTDIPRYAWRVSLTDAGDLRWTARSDKGPQTADREPEASLWRRTVARVLSWFPIERLL